MLVNIPDKMSDIMPNKMSEDTPDKISDRILNRRICQIRIIKNILAKIL